MHIKLSSYQAIKTNDPISHLLISGMSASESKKAGRNVEMRPDWDEIKDIVMYELVKQKFNIPELRKLLLSTGEVDIIEGNLWGDVYWALIYVQDAVRTSSVKYLCKLDRNYGDEDIYRNR